MIYAEPQLNDEDAAVLVLIRGLSQQLAMVTQNSPRRWIGSLRRSTFARNIQGSNSIEGYHVSIDEAIAAIENEPPRDERSETWQAISGYRDALTYIMQAAQDPYFAFSKQFLKSLHFMMIKHALDKHPGQWRPGVIFVVNQNHETVYEGPQAEDVDGLVQELVDYLAAPSQSSPMIKAAMAHLNLTMIHPFKDGNGRMARALQTLVLAREGILHPVFCSIEAWLGRNTAEYYATLAATGQGQWNPGNDARLWLRFCLKAHFQQCQTLIRRTTEHSMLFDEVEQIIWRKKLDERMAIPMTEAARGMRLTNAQYQKDADVMQYIASRDLKKLSDLGLIEPFGEKRGRFYRAGPVLRKARDMVRIKQPLTNPYDIPQKNGQPLLPTLDDARLA